MFAALGVEVHLVERRGSLLPFLDHEIGERLLAAMVHHGVIPHLNDHAEQVGRDDAGVLTCRLASGTALISDQVLVTSGRSGNTPGLGLEAAGVAVERPRLRRGRRRLRDGGARHLRRRRRHRLPRARLDLDGAGARGRVPRVRLRLQAGDVEPAPLRRLHDPRGELRGPERAGGAPRRASTPSSGARSSATTRAARSSATRRDGEAGFDRATRRLIGCHCIGERASELVHIGRGRHRPRRARWRRSSRWCSTTRRWARPTSTRPTTPWAACRSADHPGVIERPAMRWPTPVAASTTSFARRGRSVAGIR